MTCGTGERKVYETPASPPGGNNTCAVVVSYHPDGGFVERLRALSAQVHCVVVVDNGSGQAASRMLDAAESDLGMVTLRNSTNLGIAAAMNQGICSAQRAGYAWTVTLDQDSLVLPAFFNILIQAYRSHPNPGRLAMIGSSNVHPSINLPPRSVGPETRRDYRMHKTVITSGSLMSLSAFASIGPFREELFIDSVDEEYCLRARRHGFEVISTLDPGLVHTLGDMSMHRILGRRVLVTNHSPLRRYYITRNAARLIWEYLFIEPRWALRKLFHSLKELLFVGLFETSTVSKYIAAGLGVIHAVSGKSGKLDPVPKIIDVPATK